MRALCSAQRVSRLNPASLRSPSVQRANSFTVFAGFDFLKNFTGSSNTKSGTKAPSAFGWARKASMGCELAPKEAPDGLELGTFAGGCFWGLELLFQRVPGVVSTSVGYTQGQLENPTYEVVCSGSTGHTEAVQVTYNPNEVTFEGLLETFAGQIDLTTLNRQGSDRGTQYRSGVYYHSDEQKAVTEAFYAKKNEEFKAGKFNWISGKEVVAELLPAGDYYIAEGYHQQYLSKGGRFGSGQSAEKGNTDKIRCYG